MREDETTTETKIQHPDNETSSTPKTGKTAKWKPVLLPLEPNFLRLSSERNEEYCDEFAVMLQNEEFLAELR